MGGVWKSMVFILLLATVEGAWLKKSSSKKSDTKGQANVKEIIKEEISTLGEGEYMTKRTGKSGDSLIIGSYSAPLYTSYLTTDHYECELVNNVGNIYKQIYEPEIYKRTSDSYEMSQAEEKQSQAVAENFIHIKMEIWKCTKLGTDIKATYALFHFIRNEFISFKEIRDIKYVSGVDVSLIDYASDQRRVKVVETKYFHPKGHTKHGEEDFEKASPLNFKLKLMAYERQTPYPKPGLAFEVKYPNEKNLLIHEIESSGEYLRLGPYLETDASRTPNTVIEAQCEPLQGMNPALRRPEVFKIFEQSSQNSAQYEDRSIYAKLSDKEFEDLFIITRRKFWKCTSNSNGKGTSTSEHKSFHRVMHEVVGRKPIKKVKNGFGIQEIVSVQMPDQQQAKTVRFTIVDNFYMHDLSRITNPVSLTYKEEKRLNATILSGAKEIIDVDFRLTERAVVFRTFIGDEGYDLRVGSEQKLKYINTDKEKVITCTKTDYSDEYETNFKIIMKTGDKFHRTSDVLVETNKYYKYLSKNAWKCTGKSKNSQTKFVRVVNELQVLVKVNEVETFDGVEIFYDGSDVKLVETKYYYSHPGEVKLHTIKLDFKIELNEEGAEANSARAENSPAEMIRSKKQLVSKMNDEIVTWVDHYSNTKHALKFKGEPRTHSLRLSEAGHDAIRFTYTTKSTTVGGTAAGVQTNIYICEPKENTKPMALYDVYSNDDSSKPIYQQTDLGNNEYFNVNFEVQECNQMIYNQKPNTDDEVKQIYRVVSEQTLKDEKVTAISTVSYDEVLRDVGWFETGSEGNQYKLKLKSFRYYNNSQTSPDYPILHEVSDDETHLPKPVAQPIAGWKSGSMTVDNMDQKREKILVPTRINYLERLHETKIPQIPSSGLVQINKVPLIIGSKWTKVFGSYESELNCNFKDVEDDDTTFERYKTEMKKRDGTSVKTDDYLDQWYQEVWECTSTTESNTAQVYRIVNEYKIKSDKLNRLNVLYNYDGVTIYRTKPIVSAIENINDPMIILVKEIKYIYEESVVKFEGVIKLTKENHAGTRYETKNALPHSPHRTRNSCRRDIMLLEKNFVFQTVIVNDRGQSESKRIYEFGENSQIELEQGLQIPDMKCEFKLDTVENGETIIDWNLMTKVSLYWTSKEGGTKRVSYDKAKTDEKDLTSSVALTSFNQRIWNCERKINDQTYPYKRVQNEFKIVFMGRAREENVLIYHYEGVTVTGGSVREVKYYNAEGTSIRYDGVVWLAEPTGEQAGSILKNLHLDDKSGREVYYYLDRPMLEFKSVSGYGNGKPVQFGEPADSNSILQVIQPMPDKPVTCKTYSGGLGDIRTWTATKLFTTQQSGTSNKFASSIEIIPGKEDSGFYFYKNTNNIWECEREQDEQLFLRVENIYVPSYKLYPMDTLFVADGLTLKTIILPDKSENFLITEVKYLKQKRNEKNELSSLVPVKFDGEVLLVVEKPSTIMKRLYPSSSDYELFGSDTNGKYWSMDALKTQSIKIKTVYAMEKVLQEDDKLLERKKTLNNGAQHRKSLEAAEARKSATKRRGSMTGSIAAATKAVVKVTTAVTGSRKETEKIDLPAVIYKEKGKVYAIALGGTGRRTFHIAADDWTGDADRRGYFCIQDTWSPKDRLRFMPKVIERIDDFNYELNEEALLMLFKVEQEVHVCNTENRESEVPTLTRVTTTLETDADGINAVSYSGSARVDIVKRDGKNKPDVMKVTIDTFIDVDSSTIYKSDTRNFQYETKFPQNVLTKLASIINPKKR